MSTKGKHRTLPLWGLLKRELANEKAKKPEIAYGQANESKKGEDFTLLRNECHTAMGNGVSTFSAFGLFDGHRGSGAAIYAKENLLKNILHTIPSEITRDEWIAALSRALVSGFVKTDKDFQVKACKSGTTATLVIIQGWVVTVASVGDSSCILESAAGDVYHLSADHRLECNEEERDRITASGGKIRRLNAGYGGIEFGPLRCWPGGLCLSRSIGDKDVGEFIVPVPFVKQMKLPKSGGRLIISSHGVWDALTAEAALDWCRGVPAEVAASQVVNEALQAKGLRDDTTCIVIDILPHLPFPAAPKKQQVKGAFKSLFRSKSTKSYSNAGKRYTEADVEEELFEE
ncbi:Protein phosphatase 2C family protein [Melia azedarach]|uniref:Protein phosphatase 2C family protein n=1 Tax=Melia azedarach TaxID=155640 RepID=A0ACC1XR76_MELAZ|nr:Protein phosphatase 2C family protein [Melia azedarach]